MKLSELEGHFARYTEYPSILSNDPGRPPVKGYRHEWNPAEAQGVEFLCPRCFTENSGPLGTHRILLWFLERGVPPDAQPEARWVATGTGIDDLTLTGPPGTTSSVNVDNNHWHGFITNGEAIKA